MALVVILLNDDLKDNGVAISAISEPAFPDPKKGEKLSQAQMLALHMIELSRALGEKKPFYVRADGRRVEVEQKTGPKVLSQVAKDAERECGSHETTVGGG